MSDGDDKEQEPDEEDQEPDGEDTIPDDDEELDGDGDIILSDDVVPDTTNQEPDGDGDIPLSDNAPAGNTQEPDDDGDTQLEADTSHDTEDMVIDKESLSADAVTSVAANSGDRTAAAAQPEDSNTPVEPEAPVSTSSMLPSSALTAPDYRETNTRIYNNSLCTTTPALPIEM